MVSGVEEDFKYKIKPIIEVIANKSSIQNDLVDILNGLKINIFVHIMLH